MSRAAPQSKSSASSLNAQHVLARAGRLDRKYYALNREEDDSDRIFLFYLKRVRRWVYAGSFLRTLHLSYTADLRTPHTYNHTTTDL